MAERDLTPAQLKEKNKLLAQGKLTLEEQEKLHKLLNVQFSKSVDYLEKENNFLAEIAEKTKDKRIELELAANLQREALTKQEELLKKAIENGDETEALVEKWKLIKDSLEDANEKQSEYNKLIGEAESKAADMGKMLGLAASFEETAVGSAIKHGKAMATNAEYREKHIKQLGKTFSVMNIIASVGAKIFEVTLAMAKAYDTAQASFNKATGAAGEYNETINSLSHGSLALGVGVTEGAAALEKLYTGMASFSTLNKATAEDLARTTATLEQVGVESAVTAKIMNDLTKGLAMTAEEAMQMQKDLAEFDIGISPGQLAADFQASIPIMMKWGKTVGLQVFKKLEKQAKSTGLAMQDLLGIAGQFNTFESAAEMAGKLNAVLGGNMLNSVELVTATEAERIEMMRNAVFQSGQSWKSMNHLERQMFANIMTSGDMTKASKLLTHQTQEEIEAQRELSEMAAKSQDIMKKLEKAVMQLGIALGPLIDEVSIMITEFSEWADQNQETIKGWKDNIIFIGKLVGIIVILKLTVFPLIGFLVSLSMAASGTAPAITAVGAAAGQAGVSMTAGAGGLLAFGAAALMVGIGVGIAALGISAIAFAFSELDGGQILGAAAAIVAFTLAIVGIFMAVTNPLGAIGVGIVVALSLAFAAMGLGIAAAARELTNFGRIMNTVSASKSEAFKEMIDDFEDLVQAVGTVPQANLQNTAKLAAALAEATKIKATITTAPMASTAAEQRQRMSMPNRGQGSTTVILKLKDRVLAKGVIDSFEKEMDISLA